MPPGRLWPLMSDLSVLILEAVERSACWRFNRLSQWLYQFHGVCETVTIRFPDRLPLRRLSVTKARSGTDAIPVIRNPVTMISAGVSQESSVVPYRVPALSAVRMMHGTSVWTFLSKELWMSLVLLARELNSKAYGSSVLNLAVISTLSCQDRKRRHQHLPPLCLRCLRRDR